MTREPDWGARTVAWFAVANAVPVFPSWLAWGLMTLCFAMEVRGWLTRAGAKAALSDPDRSPSPEAKS